MGGSAYPREWPYKEFRAIADEVGALLMMDMAHISGLVATGEAENPFQWADVVTTTTHKSLRGPRAGMIFYRLKHRKDGSATGWAEKINMAVFPGLQGGPHEHQIAADRDADGGGDDPRVQGVLEASEEEHGCLWGGAEEAGVHADRRDGPPPHSVDAPGWG
eukprot:Sspe_Gene.3589::Locus_1194_Transcript_1_1_Confidence_1.000_Length_1181::g.3589::m.3589/K00600/glyA, SHMT; glycine hydroxymethyltransferase